MFVPVVDAEGRPLMPCHPARARELVHDGKALRRFDRGLFYIRLIKRTGGDVQEVAVGIDPGSKREGLTVKSEARTLLNIQADAVTWVKGAVEARRNARSARRGRNTPYRQNRPNRARGGLPPSTKARWQWKLRMGRWLARRYPISRFVVEDIKAKTKGKRRWDAAFSPLEVGKTWFYEELGRIAKVDTKQGWETKELRDVAGLKKTGAKMADVFGAHCVDSWVLANSHVGGHVVPDNTRMLRVVPLQFHRRQLHRFQPSKGGVRTRYGGTRSLGFKRGSLVKHPKYGLTYVGGNPRSARLSLHDLATGRRVCEFAKPVDLKFVTFSSWRTTLLDKE